MHRRAFLAGSLAAFAVPQLTRSARAAIQLTDLRGSFGAEVTDLRPEAPDDQSRALQKAIDTAAAKGRPLFLPAGSYTVSNLRLPNGAHLVGVPGQTRPVYRGDGHLIFAEDCQNIGLEGLLFDGANRALGDYAPGLAHISRCTNTIITDCEVQGSTASGIVLERSSGRVENSIVSGAAKAGIRSMEVRGLTLRGNTVTDCANGGILVHR